MFRSYCYFSAKCLPKFNFHPTQILMAATRHLLASPSSSVGDFSITATKPSFSLMFGRKTWRRQAQIQTDILYSIQFEARQYNWSVLPIGLVKEKLWRTLQIYLCSYCLAVLSVLNEQKVWQNFMFWHDVWMKMKGNIKFQDDRDKQQTDVGSKKYRDNESEISCSGETAGPFTFLISHIHPDLREMIVTVPHQYTIDTLGLW